MQNVVTFWSSMFSVVSDFLMAEPVVYFVALILLMVIVALLQRVFNISRF